MSNWLPISLLFFSFAAADLPKISLLPSSEHISSGNFPSGESISFLPSFLTDPTTQSGGAQHSSAPKGANLTEPSKLNLIRLFSGEFAKVRKALPGGKEGFILYTVNPLNLEYLGRLISTHCAVSN